MQNEVNARIARAINGARIVHVRLNPFPDGRGKWTGDPVFVFDDERALHVQVHETDVGRYGINFILGSRPPKR